MTITCVAVFGGSGFLGRAIVNRLAATGATVRVAVRNPGSLKPPDGAAPAGRIVSTYADVRDETSVDVPWRDATPPSMPLDFTSNGAMKHSGPSTSWARFTLLASRRGLVSKP